MKQNMKFRVKDEAHSKAIQDALFAEGYRWFGRDGYYATHAKHLFASSSNNTITYADEDVDYFDNHDNVEHELVDGVIQIVECLPKPTHCPPMPSCQQPIGLRPKCVVDTLRTQEILEAMSRYAAGGKKIPMVWIEELADLNMEKV